MKSCYDFYLKLKNRKIIKFNSWLSRQKYIKENYKLCNSGVCWYTEKGDNKIIDSYSISI